MDALCKDSTASNSRRPNASVPMSQESVFAHGADTKIWGPLLQAVYREDELQEPMGEKHRARVVGGP